MKKVSIPTHLLKKALAKLNQAVNSKSPLPVLENVYFKISEGNAELIASDLEVTIKYKLLIESTDSFDFMVPLWHLSNILKVCSSEEISFSIHKKSVKIVAGSDVFEASTACAIEDYPKAPEPGNPNQKIDLDPTLSKKLVTAMDTVSKEILANQRLTVVCLDIEKDQISAVSTNAHLLFKYTVPGQSKTETQILLYPRVIKSITGVDQISVTWDKKFFVFNSPELVVIVKRPDFKFPDYKVVIPPAESNLQISKQDIVASFSKCDLVTENFKFCSLKLSKDKVSLSVKDEDKGLKIDVESPCNYTGDIEKIILHTGKMLTVLNQAAGENLSLSITGERKAVLIRDDSDENYLGLIMPVGNS